MRLRLTPRLNPEAPITDGLQESHRFTSRVEGTSVDRLLRRRQEVELRKMN